MVLSLIVSFYLYNNPLLLFFIILFFILIGGLVNELDKYNLNNLTINELRKECKNRNIKANVKKKKDYIDLLLNYNCS